MKINKMDETVRTTGIYYSPLFKGFVYYKNGLEYRDDGPSVILKDRHYFVNDEYVHLVEDFYNLPETKNEFKLYYLNNLDEFKIKNKLVEPFYSSKKYIDEYNELLNIMEKQNSE